MPGIAQLIRDDINVTDTEWLVCEMHDCLLAIGSQRLVEVGIMSVAATGAVGSFRSANDAIERLQQLAQRTRPVRNFDARTLHLMRALRERVPKQVLPLATKLVDWAKAHPETQALIVAGLSAALTLGLGSLSGAAAGYALGFVVELLKGERASTAVLKGTKNAAIGAATGTALRQVPFHTPDWVQHLTSTKKDIMGNQLDPKDWRGPLAKWLGFSK